MVVGLLFQLYRSMTTAAALLLQLYRSMTMAAALLLPLYRSMTLAAHPLLRLESKSGRSGNADLSIGLSLIHISEPTRPP